MHKQATTSRVFLVIARLVWVVLLVPSMAFAQGVIISPPPEPPSEPRILPPRWPRPIESWTPFAIAQQRVDVAINDLAAETTVEQVFVNRGGRPLEGTYLFPIPEDAAVHNFTMWMNGKEVGAELLDAERARQIYESIVSRMRDPALLQVVGCGLIQAKVFPIPPGGECRIRLKYSGLARSDGGLAAYRFPLNAAAGRNQPIEMFSLRVTIRTSQPLTSVFSPSHECSISRNGDREAVVGLEKSQLVPDNDFQLLYKTGEETFGLALLTHKPYGEDGYFMARIAPRIGGVADAPMPKNICFVLDTSGSMADDNKIAQAKKALKFCITNLGQEDRFSLITFATEVRPFRADWGRPDDATLNAARAFIDEVKAVGGTDINAAMQQALSMNPARSKINASIEPGGEAWRKSPYFIVFITDGEPTVGVIEPGEILKNVAAANNAKDARVFVLGVGFQVNTKLLDRMADDNSGARDYVTPTEDLELKISSFYTKLANPVLAALKLAFEGVSVSDVYPKALPDLFKGSELVIVGRCGGPQGGAQKITLTGTTRGDTKTFTYECRFPAEGQPGNDFLPRVWAVRKIGYLLDEIRLHGENKEVKDEIVRLSKLHGIMTPYTSFLVQEDVRRAERLGVPMSAAPAARATGPAMARRGVEMKRAAADQDEAVGEGAVDASRGNAGLQQTDAGVLRQRLLYDASNVNRDDAGRQVINFVGAKTFYNDGGRWIDAEYDGKAKPSALKLYSKEYYDFIAANKGVGRFLAQGERVVLCWNGQVYETAPDNGPAATQPTTGPTG
jgi:Ca-activated chloride channel family protein